MSALVFAAPLPSLSERKENELDNAYSQIRPFLPALMTVTGREITDCEVLHFALFLDRNLEEKVIQTMIDGLPLYAWQAAYDAAILPEESVYWNEHFNPPAHAPIPKDFEDYFVEREMYLKRLGERKVLTYKHTRRNEGKKQREFSTWLRKQRRVAKRRFDDLIADYEQIDSSIPDRELESDRFEFN